MGHADRIDHTATLAGWSMHLERSGATRRAMDRAEAVVDRFVMFFTMDGELYATDDVGRRTYFDLMNGSVDGDEPLPDNYKSFAAFTAVELSGSGEAMKFRHADLKKMKILPRKAAVRVLAAAGAGTKRLPDDDAEGEMPGGKPVPEDF